MLADLLKQKREARRWSARTAGKKLGVSDAAVLGWESGKVPNGAKFKAICQTYGIAASRIVELAARQGKAA